MAIDETKMEPKPTPTRSPHKQPALEEIVQALRDELPELRQHYGVCSLGVFGSYVRGEQERGSDLDILVEFDRVPTLFEFVRLERHLSQQLGVPVDLVMKTALKPAIGRYILEEVVSV
jgi:predicted nucleotidyltransferase